jgi:GH43 family beta-xylosidase
LDSKGYYYYGEINGVSFSVDAKTKDQIAVSYENTILVLDSSKRDAVTGNWKVKFNITTDYDIESIKFAPFFNFVYINSVYIPSLKSKVIEQMKYNMNYNASTKQYEG